MALESVSTILTGVNLILLISLLVVYVRNFSKMRSAFTLCFLLFGLLFLLQNLVSFYFLITMMPYILPEFEMYSFVFTILQTMAFAILSYITWK